MTKQGDDFLEGKTDPFSFAGQQERNAKVVAGDHHKEHPVNVTFIGKSVVHKKCDFCEGLEYVMEEDTLRCNTCGVKYFRSRNKYYLMYKTIPKGKDNV